MFRGGKDGEIRLIGKETDGVAQVEEGIQGEGDVEEELELSQVLDDSPYMNRAQETEEGKEAVADCANLADHSFPHHHRDCTHRPRVVWMSPIQLEMSSDLELLIYAHSLRPTYCPSHVLDAVASK
jgi:hypothetical protein